MKKWAVKRRFFVLAIFFGFVLIILIGASSLLKTNPSCFDSVQNGLELGVDCGGSCESLCVSSVQPLKVLFAQYISNGEGSSVVAHIQNPNKDTIASAEYELELFQEGELLFTKQGQFSVAGEEKYALVFSNVPVIKKSPRVFLSLKDSHFKEQKSKESPNIKSFSWSQLPTEPKLSIVIMGEKSDFSKRVPLIVTVFDSNNEIIAVSSTVVEDVNRQEPQELFLTWNSPFKSEPSRVEFIFNSF